jgi:hypothetical protein
MASTKKKYPHYRLEQTATGLGVALTTAGFRSVEPKDADTFPTASAALIAGAGQCVDLVRVDRA